MRTTRVLRSLLIASLLVAASMHATSDAILLAMEDGETVTNFKVGDSNCEVVDGRIRCTFGK